MSRLTTKCSPIGAVALLILVGTAAQLVASPTRKLPHSRSDCIAEKFGEGGSPVVAARVNGQGPFLFILDTGSSGTTLGDHWIRQLHLVADAPPEQGQGMSGATDVRIFKARSFDAGPLHVINLAVAGVPAPTLADFDIAGLAGVDLFGRRLVVWGQDRQCVQIKPSGTRPGGSGWGQITSRWLKPWKLLIPVQIGGVDGWGLLDTGSQQTILSSGFARRIGLAAKNTKSAGGITGIDGHQTELSSFVLSNATVGRWRYVQIRVSVAALPLFVRLGGSDAPLAIIGMDWIGHRRFAIDYGNQSIWQAIP